MQRIYKATNILVALYFGVLLSVCFFPVGHYELSTEESFHLGEATSYGVSIGSRIAYMYKLILVSFLNAGVIYWLLGRFTFLHLKKNKKAAVNILLFTLISGLLNPIDLLQNELFVQLNVILIGFYLIEKVKERIGFSFTKRDAIEWALIGFSFQLLFSNILLSWLLTAVLIIIEYRIKKKEIKIARLFFVAAPLLLFMGVESTLILNQRGVFLGNYWLMTAVITGVLLLYVYFTKNNLLDDKRRLNNVVVPIFLLGQAIFTFYSPIIDFNAETFELANKLNPLTETILHSKLPLFDFMSSHLLSDFFWEFFYVSLNGFDGTQSPLIYSGFTLVLGTLFSYVFLRNYLGTSLFALILVALAPSFYFFLPSSFYIVFIPMIFLVQFLKSQKSRSFILFISSSLFVCFWRLDLGVALIGAEIIVLPLLFYFFPKNRKAIVLSTATVIIFGFALLIGVEGSTSGRLAQLMHYFGASQAHGIHVLAFEDTTLFYLDFVIMPLVMGAITLFLLVKLRAKEKLNEIIPLLLMLGIYFFNLQRGLVRHSFVENNEVAILSISWLILGLFLYQFIFKQHRKQYTLVLLMASSLFSLHTINEWKSLAGSQKNLALSDLPELKKEKVNRVRQNVDVSELSEVVAFLKGELNSEETFIDFSNTPILYYYSQKEVPSYFCQYLQNTVDGYLQEVNLKRLAAMNIPYVVFNHIPETFFDVTDGIQNEVRYYRLTSYIYDHYVPFKNVGGFMIWKKKNETSLNLQSFETEKWYLGLNPFYWKAEKQQHFSSFGKQSIVKNNEVVHTVHSSESFLNFGISTEVDQNVICTGIKDTTLFEFHFRLKAGEHSYRIPAGSAYNCYMNDSIKYQIIGENAFIWHTLIEEKLSFEH